MTPRDCSVVVVLMVLAAAAGCTTIANSPMVQDRLQLASAGHTGCLPDDNVITNLVTHPDGSGMWNATCKDKVYLCSAVSSTGNSETFSCAPAVQ